MAGRHHFALILSIVLLLEAINILSLHHFMGGFDLSRTWHLLRASLAAIHLLLHHLLTKTERRGNGELVTVIMNYTWRLVGIAEI